ncbi:hypothetical protein BH09PLA1_BH09PLA1_06630 [soil metagenome]
MNPGFETFYQLVKKDDANGLRRLVASGWNVNGDGSFNPLCWVHGNTKFIEILLDAGAEVNPTVAWDMTPLVMAAMEAKTRAVGMLLKAGARVAVNPQGCSLFTWTMQSRRDHPAITEMLLAAGASPELRDNLHVFQRTPREEPP